MGMQREIRFGLGLRLFDGELFKRDSDKKLLLSGFKQKRSKNTSLFF